MSGAPASETAEPVLMMLPPRPASLMARIAYFMFSHTPRTFTCRTRSKSADVYSWQGITVPSTPALLNSTSSAP